jgi:hypothetical protein
VNLRTRQLVAGSLLAITVAACGTTAPMPATTPAQAFAIRAAAAQPQACEEALMVGSLERTPLSGLGIGTAEGLTPVEWPFGYRARLDGLSVVLLDGSGKVVAREHDRVHVGGGLGAGQVWFACGTVSVESSIGG